MSQAPRILVVDDEARICEFLSVLLRKAGYEVETHESGPAALEALEAKEFDLLITDFVMPGMNGAEVIEKARKIRPDIPAIAITGFATVDTAEETMRAGADNYISKPFDVNQLKAVIAQQLEKGGCMADCERLLSDLRSADTNTDSRRAEGQERAAAAAAQARASLKELTAQIAGIRVRLEASQAATEGLDAGRVAQTVAVATARELGWPGSAVFVQTGEKTQ